MESTAQETAAYREMSRQGKPLRVVTFDFSEYACELSGATVEVT